MYDRLRPPPIAVDVVIVGVLALALGLQASSPISYPLLSLAQIATLTVRRIWPVISFTAISLLYLIQLFVIPRRSGETLPCSSQ